MPTAHYGVAIFHAPFPPPSVRVLPTFAQGLRVVRDVSDGGGGRVYGDTALAGPPAAPVSRRVRLFHERSGRLLREVWSDPVTGAWSFDWIAIGPRYTAVSYDYTGSHRAVVADNLEAEPMP